MAPLLLALVAFLLAFVVDPPAVGRLIWACVNGQFGEPLQIAGSAVLLGLVGVTGWAFRPAAVAPAAKQPVRRPRQRARVPAGDQPGGGGEPEEAASAPRRRTRSGGAAKPAADAPGDEGQRQASRPAPANRLARERDGESKPRRSRVARAPAADASSEPDATVARGKS